MQSDRHTRISDRAYQIWLAEGRIHGRDGEHWRRAEHEIAEEEAKHAAALAERAGGGSTGGRARTAKTPAKAASAAAKPKAPSLGKRAAPAKRNRAAD